MYLIAINEPVCHLKILCKNRQITEVFAYELGASAGTGDGFDLTSGYSKALIGNRRLLTPGATGS
ncbi:MAG: hypothetical protein ACSLE5_08975 [Porticoccaceae bacterium]